MLCKMSDGGARVSSGVTGGLKKTIQDIREIAGQHSDEDIYAMLRECSMDPNETTQRLLHLDTFHEVKKKHGRRKEDVEIRNNPGKQNGARVGKGVKVGQGNFYPQNVPHKNERRSLGGSKENGYINMSKGHKLENKIAPQNSRSVRVKVNENNSQDGAPEANVGNINSAGHDSVPDILITEEGYVPADGSKQLAPTLTPASDSAKQGNFLSNGNHENLAASGLQPASSMSSETVHHEVVLSLSNSIHEDQYAILSEDASWSNDIIHNGGSIPYVPKRLIDCDSNGKPWVAKSAAKDGALKGTDNCVEEQFLLEGHILVLNLEASKPNKSDGHVVFPDHLQVPEAYKAKLNFGSFDSCWALDGKQASDDNGMNRDKQADDPFSMITVANSSIESSGTISSSVKDARESEDPIYSQSLPPISENTPPLTANASSDIVVKIDEPQCGSLLRNGGPDPAIHSSNYVFGYAPHAQLQAHDRAETQGGNFIASSASSIDQNSIIQSSGVTHDLVSSPPPTPLARQMFHPNFLPYGHYYPQFFLPQVQQYIPHGGFFQQPSVANLYFTSAAGAAAAAGIKYPHQQQKQGLIAGTDGYIGVPSGYNPYVPYAFPSGLPPVVIPGNVGGDDDHAARSKENTITNMTEQQIESSGEWMAGSGRTVSGLQVSPFYGFAPGQGHPMVFPPTMARFGAFGGVYHPAAQTIPPPQPTVPPHMQQHRPMGSAETAAAPKRTYCSEK